MNFRQLEYFRVTCDSGSIGRAAERLYISRPSLSASIGGLEHELGTTLLVRGKSGVVPTTSGKALLDFIKVEQEAFAKFQQLIESEEIGGRRVMRLGCPGGVINQATVANIYEYEKMASGVSVEIVNRECPDFWEAVEARRLDLAVTVCPPPQVKLSKVCINPMKQNLIVNRFSPLADRESVDFSHDLFGMVLLETEGRFTPYLAILKSLGIQRKMVGEDRGFIRQLIAHDRGCVLTIPTLVDRYAGEDSCVLPVHNIPLEIDLNPYLVFRSDIDNETRRFANHVLACLDSREFI